MTSPIIVALDYAQPADALALADRLDPTKVRLKVGKELFTRTGPQIVEKLASRGFEVFLDLKFHDIPNTVRGAVAAAADVGAWMLNVHAGGGPAMLEAARAGVPTGGPLLIAVTVLTSMDARQLTAVGVNGSPENQVLRLAELTATAELDGVVCSPLEAAVLTDRFGPDFCLVTPGVRPADAASDDQQRIATPSAALAAGAHYLVIGRPITRADDPAAAADAILESIAHVSERKRNVRVRNTLYRSYDG